MNTAKNWISEPVTAGLHWFSERFSDGSWSTPCVVEVVLDEGPACFLLVYMPNKAADDVYRLDIYCGETYIIRSHGMKFLHIAPPETPCS